MRTLIFRSKVLFLMSLLIAVSGLCSGIVGCGGGEGERSRSWTGTAEGSVTVPGRDVKEPDGGDAGNRSQSHSSGKKNAHKH